MEIIETQFGQGSLSIETGRLASQASGSALVRYGDTVVLVASMSAKGTVTDNDFFPLSVFYVEKGYAGGRIPGGFFKREGRLTDQETLFSRMIDRSLRPLFHPNFNADTVVNATVLSYDESFGPDVAAMIGASASLVISDIPYQTPVAGARVGYVDGSLVLNPTPAQLEDSSLNIFMTASKDSIVMVEGEASEVSESLMIDALMFGLEGVQPVITLQEELVKRCGKIKREVPEVEVNQELVSKVDDLARAQVQDVISIKTKTERYNKFDEVVAKTVEALVSDDENGADADEITQLVSDIKKEEMRQKILKEQQRIDGRGPRDIRPVSCELGVLPRAHGSAIFNRGETQALGVTTLGTKDDEQMIDSMTRGLSFKKFLMHYNFPSFAVGEARPPRGPGRREIGHGFLAERGLTAMLPKEEEFPYTVRVVSEILACNGSSSMATVCAGSLSMMDAGVPVKAATAGIAMGLIHDEENPVILSDILGDEDHLGDMDFKVVGTEKGLTALQMDIKITGLKREIIERALEQAREGLDHILGVMKSSIDGPRQGLSNYAPRFVTHKVSKDKISVVIGPGGKNIKGITEKTGAKISIDDDGIVQIASKDHRAVDEAVEMIKNLTQEPEIGKVYNSIVKKITDFGAFVEIYPGQEGLVHISKLSHERVRNVSDVVKEGDRIDVKATGFDKRGKLQLSAKDV